MPAKPITIGSHRTSPKEAMPSPFLQAMLNRYDVGDKVSAADEELLRAALALHPEGRREDRLRCNALQRQERRLRLEVLLG